MQGHIVTLKQPEIRPSFNGVNAKLSFQELHHLAFVYRYAFERAWDWHGIGEYESSISSCMWLPFALQSRDRCGLLASRANGRVPLDRWQ